MRDGKVHHHANPFAAMSFHCLLSVLEVLLGGQSRVLGTFGVFLRFVGVNVLWVNVGFLSLKGEMEKLIIMSIHLPLCRFVPNERTEGPLEGHRP